MEKNGNAKQTCPVNFTPVCVAAVHSSALICMRKADTGGFGVLQMRKD